MSTTPKHTIKGMTREQIAKQSHERRMILLAYIERNGRCDMNQLEAGVAMPRVVLFQWLRKMTETGHIITEQEATKMGLVNYYSRGANQEPLQVYAHGAGRVQNEPRDMVVKRNVVKATQLGMRAYQDLPREFFGPARAEVQA
jgi:hypothetical protein